MTLGGLLALSYTVVVSYKRASASVVENDHSLALETIDSLAETFLLLRGSNRKNVKAEALRHGLNGPWITKSYLELILEKKGVPRLNTPPPIASLSRITTPKPIKVDSNATCRFENLSQPWTRSPTKSKSEPVLPTWHFAPVDPQDPDMQATDASSFRNVLRLAPMPESYDLDRGLLLSIHAIQALLESKGPPVVVGIGGPSGSGKTSLAHKMANIVGCEVIPLESYYKCGHVKDYKYDDFSALDLSLLTKNIGDLRNTCKTDIPSFHLESRSRTGFREVEVSEDCGVIIMEGIYALHPDIRKNLDLWIAVVGGVHSHLISRVQRDKHRTGCFMSQNEIMMTVFPMFQRCIEPHLVHAHLKIRNDFDPVLSPESSLFVLKSNRQVSYSNILGVLDSSKEVRSSVQNFSDLYLCLTGLPVATGSPAEGECIRVRICEGRFALLVREAICERNFILQPKVDFDIGVSTVAGLLNLGYQPVAYIEASAFIYEDGKILIQVDKLGGDVESVYVQIKGVDKEAVAAAGTKLKLEGSYTTRSYLEIIMEKWNGVQSGGQTRRLHELIALIVSQGGGTPSTSSSLDSDSAIEDLQCRVTKLERWQTFNTVLWTFLVSALIGYSLYQRNRS